MRTVVTALMLMVLACVSYGLPVMLRPWTPADITTEAWYDASDASTITESGGAVSQWDDKSGNGYDIVQGAGASQPTTGANTIGGLNTITFDDINDWLYSAGASWSQPVTYYYVIYKRANGYLSDSAGPTRELIALNNVVVLNAGAWRATTLASPIDEAHFGTVTFGTSGDLVNLNGGAVSNVADSGSQSLSGFTLGIAFDHASAPIGADVAEYIVLPEASSTDSRQRMEGYLAWKWGLEGNLPAGHPYKASLPSSVLLAPFWTPEDTTTLAWFDAADAATVQTNGTSVTNWIDKSGNARHIYQGTGAAQPTSGVNSVVFDGDDVLYNVSPFMYDNGQIEVFIVASAAPQDYLTLLSEASSTDANPEYLFRTGTSSKPERIACRMRADNGSVSFAGNISSGTAFDSTPNLAWWRDWINGGLSTFFGRVNGQGFSGGDFTRGILTNLDRFSVGAMQKATASTFFTGIIHEIVILDDQNSTSERQKMEGYLAWKWGFEDDLAMDHPYKASRPGSVLLKPHVWTPADIATVMWLDAADESTITESAGAVSQWDDKSTNGNNVIQAVGANQPVTGTTTIGGLNTLLFDGLTDTLTNDFEVSSANIAFYTVSRAVLEGIGYVFQIKRDVVTQGLLRLGTGSAGSNKNAGYRYPENAQLFIGGSTNPVLYSYAKTGTSSQRFLQNAQSEQTSSATLTTFTTQKIVLGDNVGVSQLSWEYGELIITTDVTTNTQQKIEGYLAHKWGLEANLPIDHPYRTKPPIYREQ